MKKIMIAMLALIGLGVMTNAIAAQTINFKNPKAGGVALDWCETWATNCGKPAADYFCRAKGYKKSVSFSKKNDIGYTKILKTNQVCNSPGCDSFKFITCEKKPVSFKRFNKPQYQGVALDWCYTWASNCGTKAANEYCKSKGYNKGVSRFRKWENVGYTKIMRTGQICNSPGCDSFISIDCKL